MKDEKSIDCSFICKTKMKGERNIFKWIWMKNKEKSWTKNVWWAFFGVLWMIYNFSAFENFQVYDYKREAMKSSEEFLSGLFVVIVLLYWGKSILFLQNAPVSKQKLSIPRRAYIYYVYTMGREWGRGLGLERWKFSQDCLISRGGWKGGRGEDKIARFILHFRWTLVTP